MVLFQAHSVRTGRKKSGGFPSNRSAREMELIGDRKETDIRRQSRKEHTLRPPSSILHRSLFVRLRRKCSGLGNRKPSCTDTKQSFTIKSINALPMHASCISPKQSRAQHPFRGFGVPLCTAVQRSYLSRQLQSKNKSQTRKQSEALTSSSYDCALALV